MLMYWENITEKQWNNLREVNLVEKELSNIIIYFDMDGTVVMWIKNDDWTVPHYFRYLLSNDKIIDFAYSLYIQGYDIRIISKARYDAIMDKYEWLKEHMPFIPKNKIYFVPLAADKSNFVPRIDKQTILFDDYNPNLKEWYEKGGTSIKCVTEINNVNPLYKSIFNNRNSYTNQKGIEHIIPFAIGG